MVRVVVSDSEGHGGDGNSGHNTKIVQVDKDDSRQEL